jgi:putative protein kinase ArgK-like GTPase of G3E family
MEIPDVIAINKMDHPAAKTMLNEVRSVLALDRERAWKVPIVLTEAQRGENVDELWEKIEEHRAFLEREGGWRSAAGGTSPARSSRSPPRGRRRTSSAPSATIPSCAAARRGRRPRARPADGGRGDRREGVQGSMPTAR